MSDLPANFKQYFLVFLRKGPTWTGEESPALTQRQQEHLAYLQSQYDAGHFAIYGPTEDPTEELRGIIVMKVDSLATAQQIINNDPHVKVGHLNVEIIPWWADPTTWRA